MLPNVHVCACLFTHILYVLSIPFDGGSLHTPLPYFGEASRHAIQNVRLVCCNERPLLPIDEMCGAAACRKRTAHGPDMGSTALNAAQHHRYSIDCHNNPNYEAIEWRPRAECAIVVVVVATLGWLNADDIVADMSNLVCRSMHMECLFHWQNPKLRTIEGHERSPVRHSTDGETGSTTV